MTNILYMKRSGIPPDALLLSESNPRTALVREGGSEDDINGYALYIEQDGECRALYIHALARLLFPRS